MARVRVTIEIDDPFSDSDDHLEVVAEELSSSIAAANTDYIDVAAQRAVAQAKAARDAHRALEAST